MALRILHQTERWIAVDKPKGFQVHPPEDSRHTLPNHKNCMKILRDQLKAPVFPVHRLDGGTSGILLFALDPAMAALFGGLFRERKIEKTYLAVARGFLEDSGEITRTIEGKESLTHYECLQRLEIPVKSTSRYPTTRLSLVKLKPITGRKHQLRVHLSHLAHPIVGDSMHGDTKMNRALEEACGWKGLQLRACKLEFPDPCRADKWVTLKSDWIRPWHSTFDQFGFCPLI